MAIYASRGTLEVMNRVAVIACLCSMALVGGGIAFLWPASHEFSKEEIEALDKSLLKKRKPSEEACRRTPLAGTSRPGPGTELLREALDPLGPYASCYSFSASLDVDRWQTLAAPLEASDAAWESYWSTEDTDLALELRSRCDGLVAAVASAVTYDAVCSPFSYRERPSEIRFDILSTLNSASALKIRSLVREGEVLAGAELAMNILLGWQDIGRGEVTTAIELAASATKAAYQQLSDLIVTRRLAPEEQALVHERLLRLLSAYSQASDFAMGEENTLLMDLQNASGVVSRTSQFALVAVRDARDTICLAEVTYADCARQWAEIGENGMPLNSPSIGDQELLEGVGQAVRDIASMRARFVLKAAQGYASLLALELSSRSLMGESQCPAAQRKHSLGAQLVVREEASRVIVELPDELVRDENRELLVFRCSTDSE